MATVALSELISRVDEIPVFSQTVSNILKLIENPKSSARDIEIEVLKDQGFTTKILKLANSAYFGVTRQVSSIAQAVPIVGFQAIRSMVLAASVGKVMNKALPGYTLESEALWHHAQISAITARILAKKVKFKQVEEAYTAGLLKDIGKVVLDHYLSDQFQAIIEEVNKGEKSFIEVEEMVIGYNHSQVGALVAEKWKLPLELVEAISCHHEPEKATVNPKLVAITHVSDGLIMMMGFNLGADGLAYKMSNDAMTLLGITESTLEEVMSEVADIMVNSETYI